MGITEIEIFIALDMPTNTILLSSSMSPFLVGVIPSTSPMTKTTGNSNPFAFVDRHESTPSCHCSSHPEKYLYIPERIECWNTLLLIIVID